MIQGMFKRIAGLALGIGLAAGLAAPALAQSAGPRFDGVTLRIGTFGGNWRDFVRDQVTAELEKHGAKIEWVLGSPADNLAKLVAARGQAAPFDVFEVMDATKDDVLEGGFLDKINLNNIPNKAGLRPDQYNEWLVANWTSQEALVFNEAKFKELGIATPTKYADLLNPKLAGRVSFPDITSGGGVAAIAGVNKEAGGREDNIDPAIKTIKDLKAQGYWKAGGNVVTQFRTGDVWAALINAGWGVQGINSGLALKVEHIKFADGRQGVVKLGWWGVVKGTKNQAAAEFMINQFLDPKVQEHMSRHHGLVAVHKDALANLAKDPVLNANLLLSPAQVANFYAPDFKKIDMTVWLDKWNRGLTR
jgi:putative spermidine/putrescine transport system substrate-binding protein